ESEGKFCWAGSLIQWPCWRFAALLQRLCIGPALRRIYRRRPLRKEPVIVNQRGFDICEDCFPPAGFRGAKASTVQHVRNATSLLFFFAKRVCSQQFPTAFLASRKESASDLEHVFLGVHAGKNDAVAPNLLKILIGSLFPFLQFRSGE